MVQFITGTRNMGTEMFTIMLPTFTFVVVYAILIPSALATVVLLVVVTFSLNELCKRRRQKKNGKWEWCKERQSHNIWTIGGVKIQYDKKESK